MNEQIDIRVSFVLPWHYKWLNEKLYIRVFGHWNGNNGWFVSHDDVFDSLQEPHTTNEEFLGTSLIGWNRDISDWNELEEVIRDLNEHIYRGRRFNDSDLDWLISFNKDAWHKSEEVA